MGFLDRLRAQPEWKHADAGVRLAAISALDEAEQEVFAEIAREDADARVRRAAVRRLGDVTALAAVATGDADEVVRAEAARGLLAFAMDGQDEALALRALDGLADSKDLVSVAKSAVLASVSLAALGRTTDTRARGSIARRSLHAATRLEAVGAIDDPLELTAIASRTEHRDVGLAAVEKIPDSALLARIAARARQKAVARRASQLLRPDPSAVVQIPPPAQTDRKAQLDLCQAVDALREHDDVIEIESRLKTALEAWTDLIPEIDDDLADRFSAGCEAAREHLDRLRAGREALASATRARAELLASRIAICAAIESARGNEPPDFLSRLQEEWAVQSAIPETDEGRLERRFQEATTAYEHRQASWGAAAESIASIAAELEHLAQDGAVFRGDRDALERWSVLTGQWRALPATLVEEHGPQAETVRLLEARVAEREQQAKAERERRQRANLLRLEQFCLESDAQLAAESLALKDAIRRQRQIQSLLDNPPTLPSKSDQDAVAQRLKALQIRLAPRLQELREIDDWERWANVGVQEELCARVEALRLVSDPAQIARELRDVEQRWRQASAVPREKAQTLWRRYRAAHDEVRSRVNEHFSRLAGERAENLQRKQALVLQAEELSGSTDWIRTAETIQRLQAEWKTIGTASPADERVVWERFRGACNLFFTRRREDLVERKRAWSDNLTRKEALCARAEALAESSDWDVAAAEIRALQTEWKTVGPVRRNRSEAVWQRFRAACDRFFERFQQRGQTDLQNRLHERDTLCGELEALASADPSDASLDDLAPRLQALTSRWQKSLPIPRASLADFEARFRGAFDRVVATHADRLRGSEYDFDTNRQRMEQLCVRVEELAGASTPEHTSPVQLLAARWREALASNTIGGRVDDDARLRAATREVREARAAWERIGYVNDSARRALTDRFERACRKVLERQRSAQTPSVGASR